MNGADMVTGGSFGLSGADASKNFDSILGMDGSQYYITHGVNPGAYMQGKFPFMLFGLPAAGGAMIMAAKKENREVAMSVIGAAALTSFLTGITEPIEFTFLFLQPLLYYGFHI
ncbi:MAG: PTS transporter subunit EIIC [Bacteroidales bacterium]